MILGCGASCATRWRLQVQRIEVVQLTNGVNPLKRPALAGQMGVGQLDKVPALVCPAVGQHHTGMEPGKLLVRRVPVTAEDGLLDAGQLVRHHLGGVRLIEHVVVFDIAAQVARCLPLTSTHFLML